MSNASTQFPDLDDTLRDYVAAIRPILNDNLIGVYINGSHAMGGADEDSDCDLIIVIAQPFSAEIADPASVPHDTGRGAHSYLQLLYGNKTK